MLISKKVLRPYQALNVERIRRALLNDGAQHVLYSAPMASGKTLIGKALAASLTGSIFHTFLILAPQNAIVERWREPVEIANPIGNWLPRMFGSKAARAGREKGSDRAKVTRLTSAHTLHDDGAFWRGETDGIYVATRQSVCTREVIDLLRRIRPALDHLCVVADEAHHHHDEALAGEFLNLVVELGGYVVLSTGTAWSNSGNLLRGDTVSIDYPNSRYARETDEQGRPYAPRDWVVDHERVAEIVTSDLRKYTEAANERTEPDYKARERRLLIEAIVRRFVADECPKTTINVPRVDWAALVIKALQSSPEVRKVLKRLGRPELRAVDFTGSDKKRAQDVMDRLAKEAEVKHYEDSKIDVLVSCARMDEGTDWVPCSHVYNVRVPASMILILQRWARASRSKLGIEAYPEKYKNTQTLVFFTPTLTEEAGDAWWVKHRNMAGAMAALLEDYRVAREYVNVCPALDRFRKAAKKGDKVTLAKVIDDVLVEEEFEQTWEGTEHERAEQMGRIILELERRGGKVAGRQEINALVSRLAKGDEVKADLVKQAILTYWERTSKDPAVVEAISKGRKTAAKKRGQRYGAEGRDIIRSSMRDTWDTVMERAPNLMLSAPEDRRQMAKFTPFDSARLVDVMRDVGSGFPWPEGKEALIAFAREHGEKYKAKHGEWPSSSSGQIEGLNTTWGALDAALRYRFSSSLREVFGKPPCADRYELNAQAIRVSIDTDGFEPSRCSDDPEKRRLGVALSHLRTKRPDLLDKYGIPRKADQSAAMRRARGATQFSLLADLVPRFCHLPDSNMRTPDIEGDSGSALNSSLTFAHTDGRQGHSRGLAFAPDLCQVNSIYKIKQERDADCWHFTLRGQKKPDPRPWSALLASGDNVKVEKAERTHYLDWTDLDKNGQPKRKPWKAPRITSKEAA